MKKNLAMNSTIAWANLIYQTNLLIHFIGRTMHAARKNRKIVKYHNVKVSQMVGCTI
jgi:hypothetical protein